MIGVKSVAQSAKGRRGQEAGSKGAGVQGPVRRAGDTRCGPRRIVDVWDEWRAGLTNGWEDGERGVGASLTPLKVQDLDLPRCI